MRGIDLTLYTLGEVVMPHDIYSCSRNTFAPRIFLSFSTKFQTNIHAPLGHHEAHKEKRSTKIRKEKNTGYMMQEEIL
jgi:hypothetical protein